MKHCSGRQILKRKNMLRSGVHGYLSAFLCLFMAAVMIFSGMVCPGPDAAAAEIPWEQAEPGKESELQECSDGEESADLQEGGSEPDLTETMADDDAVFDDTDDMIEEATEPDEENDAAEESAWSENPEDDQGEEASLFADEDGLIMDPDLGDGSGETDADVVGEDSIDADEVFTVMIDDPIVSNPDEISGTSGNRKKGFRSSGGFTSFYDQLEDQAKFFYDLRKSWFADERQTGRLVQPLSKNETDAAETGNPVSPCAFECDIIARTDESGNTTYAFDYTCDGFKNGYEDILYYVRASFDAFYYDHPEVFWTRSTSLGFSFGGYSVDKINMTATMYLAKITLNPVAAYDNAASQIAAFDQAVADTAVQISLSSDYDGDGTVSRPELLQGIHDFLCLRCYYDSDGLATYKATNDYSIFTPGPVFLESRAGVVCEGYSRAFKILCDQLGFDCAIVSGKAHTYSTIGHAWNAVNLSGNWYMVDATWDDVAETQEEIKYQYYLCALNTPNYGTNQLSDRAVNGKIGGNDTTGETSAGLPVVTRKKVFFFPEYWTGTHDFVPTGIDTVPGEGGSQGIPACITLYACSEGGHESVRYYQIGHDWDDGQIETAPTCEGTGIKLYTCRNNQNHTKTVAIPASGHDWGDGVILSDATCTLPGTIRYVCNNDSSHTLEDSIPIDPEAHEWDEGVVTKEPTCSETGIRTYTCRWDENHTKTETISIDSQAHDWDEGVVTKAPTCSSTGIRTYTCRYDHQHTKTETIGIDANAHEWGTGVVTKAPTCAATGIRTYTCSHDQNHKKTVVIPVDPNAHDWGAWTDVSSAAAGENAIQIRVCRNKDTHMEARSVPEGYSSVTEITAPAKPLWRAVSAKGSRKVLVKWKKVKGASGYELQYSTGKKFKKKKTVTITTGSSVYSRNIKKLNKGRTYYFRVRAFTQVNDLRICGEWSRTRSVKVR